MIGYVLDEQNRPVECRDLTAWARWFEQTDNRRVAEDYGDGWRLSTVFLGLDHSFMSGPPLLFETMLFRNDSPDDLWRCTTWDQAVAQHARELAKVRLRDSLTVVETARLVTPRRGKLKAIK